MQAPDADVLQQMCCRMPTARADVGMARSRDAVGLPCVPTLSISARTLDPVETWPLPV